MAVVNSWLLYRRECEALGVPRKKQTDQMNFKLSVASNLCQLAKPVTKKRGRSLLSSVERNFEEKKRRGPAKPIPESAIRRD